MSLPPLTQEPILHVDATPDEDYPLRILRAYRENCDCMWATTTDGKEDAASPLLVLMNEHNRKRAIILNKAILFLEKERRSET